MQVVKSGFYGSITLFGTHKSGAAEAAPLIFEVVLNFSVYGC